MTTPADRAKTLLARFGTIAPPSIDDGVIYSGYVNVGGVAVWVDTTGDAQGALGVSVYGLDGGSMVETVLRLSCVRDDDLVASIIQQVIDHHNGRQVV